MRQVDAEPGNRLRACRACRRCGRARGPTSSARRRRRPRRRGARTIDTLSPTPPVLCLPTLMPGMSTRSTRSPDRTIASVSQAVSSSVMPLQHDRHQQRRRLIVGQRSVGDAANERVDVLARQGLPVALGANDVDGSHGGRQYIVGVATAGFASPAQADAFACSVDRPVQAGSLIAAIMLRACPPEPLPPETAGRLAEFAKACKAATRIVSMYPPTHPAIQSALAASARPPAGHHERAVHRSPCCPMRCW